MPVDRKPIDVEDLKKLVRTVPDFPKPGILFYDITTLLKDKTGFAQLIDALAAHYIAQKIDLVLGIEARGFIFGPALAYRLNAGFVPVRKPRKLPAPVARVSYDLEYGTDSLEIHMDAIAPGQSVVLVDDLLATGGTMEATVKLVKQLGGVIAGLPAALRRVARKAAGQSERPEILPTVFYVPLSIARLRGLSPLPPRALRRRRVLPGTSAHPRIGSRRKHR
jgi:adenine phosphoribosyltransferase